MLRTLEQIDAMETAARASILGTFTAGKGYCDDAAYSPRSWLIHQTRVTKGTATRHTAWVRLSRSYFAATVGAVSAAAVQRYIGTQYERPWRKENTR